MTKEYITRKSDNYQPRYRVTPTQDVSAQWRLIYPGRNPCSLLKNSYTILVVRMVRLRVDPAHTVPGPIFAPLSMTRTRLRLPIVRVPHICVEPDTSSLDLQGNNHPRFQKLSLWSAYVSSHVRFQVFCRHCRFYGRRPCRKFSSKSGHGPLGS